MEDVEVRCPLGRAGGEGASSAFRLTVTAVRKAWQSLKSGHRGRGGTLIFWGCVGELMKQGKVEGYVPKGTKRMKVCCKEKTAGKSTEMANHGVNGNQHGNDASSDLLIAEWASQFDADPDAARFQLVSANIGQAKGPFGQIGLVQIFNYFIEFAAEAHSSVGSGAAQRTQVHKLDWNKLAVSCRAGLEEGDVAKMTREQIYTEHVRE